MNIDWIMQTTLRDMADRADRVLADNLMPFWAQHARDEQYGGFLTRLDRRGRRLTDDEKVLMMQVRMIHSLSAAHRHGLRERGYLEMADQAFSFLTTHFWDNEDGGFYFSVTRDGRPKSRRKNTDFHAYAITSLSEYYQASGRPEALQWAERVFDLLMDKAADRDLGFTEDFDGQDWPALNSEQMNLGEQVRIKTIDMHTNVMEGFMYLARASGKAHHARALSDVTDLICARGLHDGGCSVTAFDYDWRPVGDATGQATTSYGLNVEIGWILLEAAEVLGVSRERYLKPALGLIDHALAFGFDHERGGLAAFGPLTGHVVDAPDLGPHRLHKSWWAQAEMLNALLEAYKTTGRAEYLEVLVKEFDWIYSHQIDHECGDWYQDVAWDTGAPLTTDKGNEFKTSFHAGRSMIRIAEGIQTIMGGRQ